MNQHLHPAVVIPAPMSGFNQNTEFAPAILLSKSYPLPYFGTATCRQSGRVQNSSNTPK